MRIDIRELEDVIDKLIAFKEYVEKIPINEKDHPYDKYCDCDDCKIRWVQIRSR